MNRKIIVTYIVDIVLFLAYSILGMFLFILWSMAIFSIERPLTGDPLTNLLVFLSVPFHFLLGVAVSRFFYKKERTKLKIKISKPVFVANIVLMLGFYAICLIGVEY